jgi:uncharacterized Tic20 family protein
MKNFDLAKKIKDLRHHKGISQEELGEISGLSLRTVQRIENHETEARGNSLKRLANALNVTPDELIDWAEQEDKGYLVFLNLSALSFLAFPLFGIIIPLILWIMKKGKIRHAEQTGKMVLNFQICWSLTLFLVYILAFGAAIFHWNIFPRKGIAGIGGPEYIIFIVLFLYMVNFIYIIINALRSYNDKEVFYQPTFRFLK